MQYRGRLMPMITLHPDQRPEGMGRRPVIVFAHADGVTGLVVDAIDDIVDEVVALEHAAAARGIIGSAIIAGKATDIIDVEHLLGTAVDCPAPIAGIDRALARRNAA